MHRPAFAWVRRPVASTFAPPSLHGTSGTTPRGTSQGLALLDRGHYDLTGLVAGPREEKGRAPAALARYVPGDQGIRPTTPLRDAALRATLGLRGYAARGRHPQALSGTTSLCCQVFPLTRMPAPHCYAPQPRRVAPDGPAAELRAPMPFWTVGTTISPALWLARWREPAVM